MSVIHVQSIVWREKKLPNLEKDRTGKGRTHKCYTLWDIERTVSQRKWIEYYRK